MTPLEKTVRRVTRGALDGHHGPDRGRRLVAALDVGDVVTLRPLGRRRSLSVSLFDVYDYAIRCQVNAARLERARERKAQLAEQRAARRWKRNLRTAARE